MTLAPKRKSPPVCASELFGCFSDVVYWISMDYVEYFFKEYLLNPTALDR
jgi:hypothetical protein